jgi:hypothetical protein
MIMLIALATMVAWAFVCRWIHMDLVNAFNRATGKVLIPRRQTWGFFTWGCAAILVVALASIGLR